MFKLSLPPLTHLRRLTDDTGMLQFATWTVPNPHYGYTLDDNVRALLVVAGYYDMGVESDTAEALALRYLSFIQSAQRPDGRFHNEMSYDRRWLDEVGSEDSLGRTVWALATAVALPITPGLAGAAYQMLERALPHTHRLRSLRARAYVLLGLLQLLRIEHPRVDMELSRQLADSLLDELEQSSHRDWCWFESVLTYDNGRLPQALLLAGAALDEPRYTRAAEQALRFLLSQVTEHDIIVPVGHAGWFRRGTTKARYDQQPIDAASLVEVCATAEHVLDDVSYRRSALRAWRWFHGQNSEGLALGDTLTGGCHDGLGKNSVNNNQGAESTLAFLQAALALHNPAWLGLRQPAQPAMPSIAGL